MNSDEKVSKHQVELCRLNRVLGQVEGIKRMITEERYCVEIMTQLKAAQSALKNVELNILATHMQQCLEKAALSADKSELLQKITELTNLVKKFD